MKNKGYMGMEGKKILEWIGLDTELVNILQSKKAITFGVIFSTKQKSFAFLLDKNLPINMQLHREWVFNQ